MKSDWQISRYSRFSIQSPDEAMRKDQAALLAPVLRGLTSQHNRMIGHFRDDQVMLDFINSKDLEVLAPLGTSCPDHFLRTKIKPLVLDLAPDADLTDSEKVREQLVPAFEQYRSEYQDYYEKHKRPRQPCQSGTPTRW